MDKAERLQMIQKVWDKRNLGSALRGIIPVSRAEVRETVKETISPLAAEMNDEIRDEEQATNSRLSFDKSSKAHDRDSDSVLSASEREQLRRELRERAESFSLAAPMEFA